MSARIATVALLALSIGSGCNVVGSIIPGGNGVADIDDPAVVGHFASDIAVERISIYQGVEVDLMQGGDETGRNVPVIAGRDAMLRVFVEPDSDFEERDITAVLTIESDGEEQYSEVTIEVEGDSEQDELGTTFNFDIPAETMTSDVAFHVSLQEVDFEEDYGSDDKDAEWPADNELYELDPIQSASIEIVVIPVRYNADGSGRTPDTSEAQIQRIRNEMYAMYPVTEVNVTVGQTLNWNQHIQAYGNGWNQLLQEIAYMRSSANVDANTYYYGLFSPDTSMGNYCYAGCVAGLSLLGSEYDVWSRASIGLGFAGEGSVETLVHEVGHAHGREHAPCSLGGQPSDPGYPYSGGAIGTWGYDIVDGDLKDPAQFADMMGYCQPLWVSDYTYDNLLDRVQALSAQFRFAPAPDFDPQWKSLSLEPDGQLVPGPTFELSMPPSGDLHVIEVTDADGQVVDTVTGYLVQTSHLDGGVLLVQEADVADFSRVRMPFGTW